MRVSRRHLRMGTAVVSLAVMVGGLAPPAGSANAVAGSCDLVSLQLQPVNGIPVVQSFGGICVVSDYGTVGFVTGAAQTGSISIWASSVDVICSGTAVRGVSGTATFTVRRSNGTVLKSIPNVSLLVDAGPGSQGLNPTAAIVLDGTNFGGAGAFTRNGSGNCGANSASWSLGHLTFDDPT